MKYIGEYETMLELNKVYEGTCLEVMSILFNLLKKTHYFETCLLEIERYRKDINDNKVCLLALQKSGAIIKNGKKMEENEASDWDIVLERGPE